VGAPDGQGVAGASPGAAGGRVTVEHIEALIADRRAARARGDVGESERLQRQLAEAGVVVEDQPGGTRWKLAAIVIARLIGLVGVIWLATEVGYGQSV
jgi:hypothetical protein